MTDLSRMPTPHHLLVDVARFNDETVATLNSTTMKKLNLALGMTIILRVGERHTVLTCLGSGDVNEDRIHIDVTARNALRINLGDRVAFGKYLNQRAKSVHILPFADSIKGLKENNWNIFLGKYFDDRRRLVCKDAVFSVTVSMLTVKFKVVKTDPAGYCAVGKETKLITEGKPIESKEGESNSDGVRYSDIGGCSRQLDVIREIVELPLRFPRAFESIGIKPPRGILMFGPPGTGKTLIARAVANESSAQFFLVNGPEIMSGKLGDPEAKIRNTFEDAAKNSPAIIFFDEVDSIAPKRDKTGGEIERRVVTQLLTSMDGLTPRSHIIVMAATNRPNSIDPALRRFGRFDREVDIGIPNFAGRLQILQIHTEKMKLAEDVRLPEIASITHGYVGSDIASLCSEAAVRHIRQKIGLPTLGQDSIDVEIFDSLAVTMEDFRFALKSSNPSTLRETAVEVPNVKWDDIGGLGKIAKELRETVQYPVEYPDIFLQYRMSPSRGILLYGPPGTGKTLLAKAVATECDANFISIKGPELLSKWFGESEGNVRDIFDKARAAAPCVMFFDELDSIAKTRGGPAGDAGGASDRILNQILTEMDGMSPKKNVLIIGATNRPGQIDPALLRPGRFDRLVYVPLPDGPSRIDILRASLKGSPISEEINQDYLGDLAKRTSGFSGADLTELCQRAKRFAFNESVVCAIEHKAKHSAAEEETGEGTTAPIRNITREHFEEAMKFTKPSVQESDLEEVQKFAQFHGASITTSDST